MPLTRSEAVETCKTRHDAKTITAD